MLFKFFHISEESEVEKGDVLCLNFKIENLMALCIHRADCLVDGVTGSGISMTDWINWSADVANHWRRLVAKKLIFGRKIINEISNVCIGKNVYLRVRD